MSAANADAFAEDQLKKAVLSNAGYLGKVLVAGIALLLTLVVFKLQGTPTFALGAVNLSTGKAWLGVLVLTLAHRIAAAYFTGSVKAFARVAPEDRRRQLFQEISVSGPPIFRGLSTKAPKHDDARIHHISLHNPTTWVYLGASLLIPVASIPFERTWAGAQALHIAIALYLLAWNWTIGGSWAIAIGRLATDVRPTMEEQQWRDQEFRGGTAPDLRELQEILLILLKNTLKLAFYIVGLGLVGILYYIE